MSRSIPAAERRLALLRAQAADLVRRKVALTCNGRLGCSALAKMRPTYSNNVHCRRLSGESGMVTSLNRPGGNATGVNLFGLRVITETA